MRKIMFLLFGLFISVANAETINIDWIVDDETYTTTTCNIGDDLILPTAPTKYGYTFQGWGFYTPIEYIESTGTQWIDTNVAPDGIANLLFGIDVQYVYPYGNMNISGFGTSGNSSWLKFDIKSQTRMGIQASGVGGETSVVCDISNRNILQIDIQNGRARVNGIDYNLNVSGNVKTIINPINLFRVNGVSNSYAYARLYGAYIYNGAVLVRDFIPVLDQDGVPCMYDKVTQQFFYNAGTGDFIAGPVIE